MRFRMHLALLVLGVVLPVLLLAGILLWRGAEERRELELRALAGHALALAAAVDREIAGTLRAADVVALGLAPEDLVEPERLRPQFHALLARNPSWLNVVLLRPDGTLALDTLVPGGGAPPGPAAVPPDGVSDPLIGPVPGVPVVTVRAAVPAAPSWSVGVAIRTHHFEAVLNGTLPAGLFSAVVGSNGRFVAHTSTPQGDRTLAPAPEAVARFAAAAPPGAAAIVETRRVTGEPVDAALQRLSAAPWTASVGRPRGAVNEAVWRAMRDLAWFAAAATVLAFLAAGVLGRRLGQRIGALARAAEATGRGEVARVPGGVAEVDAVAAALERAAEAVRLREAALRRSGEDRLRLAHQIARIGSFDLRIGESAAAVTPEYVSISGLPEGTTTDTREAALARIHPADRAAHDAVVATALEGEVSGYETEFRIIRPSDGAVRTLACRAEVRHGAGGRPERLVGVIRDVTEERAVAAELRRLNAGLEARVREEVAAREAAQARAAHAERMQALGQLAGGIAHDFNNVLQAVQGGAALIERRPNDPTGVQRLARMILEATGRGVTVTRRLLAFARRDELRAEPVEPASLLASMCEVLSHTLGAEIRCRHETAPGTPRLLADKGQLETVLVNLAGNARDAMPGGGVLTFTAAREVAGPGAGRAGLLPGRYVRISVADTGGGMDATVLARVGEPFFTTKPKGKGTGLGLSMAKGFAEQSGGALTVDSTPGRGTVVSLWLPCATEEAAATADGPGGAAPSPGQAPLRRVLLVDDEPIVREVVAGELEAAGYAVLPASGGAEALALLDAGEAVDIMVTDLSMPGMGGVALIGAAQARRPRLPAVLLTGYAGDGAAIAVSGALSGRYSLLRKPVGGAQLTERIEALLAARLSVE